MLAGQLVGSNFRTQPLSAVGALEVRIVNLVCVAFITQPSGGICNGSLRIPGPQPICNLHRHDSNASVASQQHLLN
jgi:hypothetical protein